MQTIASFTVDHTVLEPGMYVSRIDGDITTYDLRTRKPNAGDYMDEETMHSVEHMLATLLRNGPLGAQILYFGPMGCATGFYLLVRDADNARVLAVLKEALADTVAFGGEIYGCSARECGNYRTLNLAKAKKEAARTLKTLENIDGSMQYVA
ncbi:MAG: S-ribosylhomocysteine lyase [Oscillospiraceae bacterium]|jgi:S-ribosylhomocysteine lyase|nr:S-ribosylhomocysteine lyase [Oscillospiraceae bacterium]